MANPAWNHAERKAVGKAIGKIWDDIIVPGLQAGQQLIARDTTPEWEPESPSAADHGIEAGLDTLAIDSPTRRWKVFAEAEGSRWR